MKNKLTFKNLMRPLSFLTLFLGISSIGYAQDSYTIYPTPQQQIMLGYKISLSSTINLVPESKIDIATINRAQQILSEHNITFKVSDKIAKGETNLILGVNGSNEIADKKLSDLKLDRGVFSLNKFDRHILNISKEKSGNLILILGENTDAVFCGLASLEQILDHSDKSLQAAVLYDFADVQNRGVIEGYYGVPYSAEVTKDLFRFMARYKMNTYMYGAKSDPYHSRYWGEPYPLQITQQEERIGYLSQDMMRDIAKVASECKVNFIWAIHPGKAFADPKNSEVISKIISKFESMYSLGIRQFGVFVDDVGVPSDNSILELCASNLTSLQEIIDSKWNKEGALPADTVKPLHYVPQLYAYSWASEEKGKEFFNSLSKVPQKVYIYITGKDVWSVPNNRDISKVASWLGNNVNWWWNYSCNDQDVTKIFIMDTYTNFRDETHILNLSTLESSLSGTNTVIVNPMQQGELSKIPLFSIADYTWNNKAFNNFHTWEASFNAVLGKNWSSDMRCVVPYLRYYDNDALGYLVMRYKQSIGRGKPLPGALIEELTKIKGACSNLKEMKNSNLLSDKLFYNDLRPWLLKLDAMVGEALALMKGENPPVVDYENNPDFQYEILGGMGEHISLAVKTAEPSAQILPEFIKWLREEQNK